MHPGDEGGLGENRPESGPIGRMPHAPMGEYILSCFQKIEKALEGPGSDLPYKR